MCPAPASRYPVEPAWCLAPQARAPAPRAALLQGRAGLLVQNGRSSSSSSRASGNASSDSAFPAPSGATLAAALARAKSPDPSPPPQFPISMTLLTPRLTTDLQTLGGSGPRATTVYDPQVILSIKDTPLVLKFCRPPRCENGSPEHHGIFDGPAVIARPTRHLAKPERLVQLAGRCVRRAHLEVHGAHAALRERLEHPLDQRTPDPLAPVGWRDPQVQDLALVGGVVCHDVARDDAPLLGHEEGYPRLDTLPEVVPRPGIGEHGPLDRADVVDVSRPGGPNRATGGRGSPPIWPALPQDVRTRAPRWPNPR